MARMRSRSTHWSEWVSVWYGCGDCLPASGRPGQANMHTYVFVTAACCMPFDSEEEVYPLCTQATSNRQGAHNVPCRAASKQAGTGT
jgi:hypothetical protein